MPENITQKVQTFNTVNESLKLTLGRDPTTDELHSELGWTAPEITRIRDYNHRDLVESGPAVAGDFYRQEQDSLDDELLEGIYLELLPEEKILFEHVTGFNGARRMKNPELCKKLNCTQAQLSYKKTQLKNKIQSLMNLQKRLGG